MLAAELEVFLMLLFSGHFCSRLILASCCFMPPRLTEIEPWWDCKTTLWILQTTTLVNA